MKVIILFVAVFSVACGPSMDPNNFVRNSNSASNANATPKGTPDSALIKQLEDIAKEAKGKVGVSAVLIETGETVGINQNEHFAMQSVVKLPISMTVLKKVQDGKLSLNQQIKFLESDLVPANMRSPIRDANPKGGLLTIRELMRFAIVESDGTAADVLQNAAGGAAGVQAFIDSLEISNMKVKHTHKEFSVDWERQYDNWTTPEAATALIGSLGAMPDSRHVVAESWAEILDLMRNSIPGANRIKGLLPADTIVAHKTGTGGTRDGITSATNDVGLIVLPNGKQMAIAVFVGDSSADQQTREAVIAKISKAIFDKWNK